MRWYYFFVQLIIVLAFIGCGTTHTLNLYNHPVSSEEVHGIIRSHIEHIHSMKGEGLISVETPEIAQTGSFIVTLRKPDSILINLEGPFGIKIGWALVTRNEFLFYNSFENKLITGSSSTENLNRILHVQLDFDDLLNFFTGGTFFEEDIRTPDDTYIEDEQYVFTYKSINSNRLYWIDPSTLVIRKVQHLNLNGKLIFEQTFSNFQIVDGVDVPYNIRVFQPKNQQMVALAYSDIVLNTDPLLLTQTIPSNAERIRW
jgi:outer membrane lipoprotein-sorting protein